MKAELCGVPLKLIIFPILCAPTSIACERGVRVCFGRIPWGLLWGGPDKISGGPYQNKTSVPLLHHPVHESSSHRIRKIQTEKKNKKQVPRNAPPKYHRPAEDLSAGSFFGSVCTNDRHLMEQVDLLKIVAVEVYVCTILVRVFCFVLFSFEEAAPHFCLSVRRVVCRIQESREFSLCRQKATNRGWTWNCVSRYRFCFVGASMLFVLWNQTTLLQEETSQCSIILCDVSGACSTLEQN